MVTPETIERVGYFNEDYDPAFFEDNDYHWRILMMGYKAYGSDWAPYSHIASRTRFENPNLVPHLRFRENKIKFFKNNLTDTVDQEVADERYAAWIKENPDLKHPTVAKVIEFALANGIVTDEVKKWLDNLTVYNVPT
jgi:GT2 family glycosyltransferase